MNKHKALTSSTYLVWIQFIITFLVFLNELYSKPSRGPFGNYPIEHKYSWEKVLVYSCAAIISYLVFWYLTSVKKIDTLFPSTWLILLLAFTLALSSVLFSHYLAFMGWCCEQPLAFYFGFPFSFLLGVGSYQISAMQPFENYGLFKIILSSEPYVQWRFLPFRFFLSSLFWFNLVFIGVTLFNLIKHNLKLVQLRNESK